MVDLWATEGGQSEQRPEARELRMLNYQRPLVSRLLALRHQSLCGFEPGGQLPGGAFHLCGGEWAGPVDDPRYLFRPRHQDAADLERCGENPPVDIDQSQDCPHVRMELLGQGDLDDVQLFGHAGYQFCAVAPPDPELRWRGPKDAAGPSELYSAGLPVLGVYNIDARRPYHDMVDICRGTGHPAVVQGDDTSVGQGVEPAGNGPFSLSPVAPRPRVPGVTEDSQERPTDHRVLFTRVERSRRDDLCFVPVWQYGSIG
jgi:hypothetical protein